MVQILMFLASKALLPLIQLMPITWWNKFHGQLTGKDHRWGTLYVVVKQK